MGGYTPGNSDIDYYGLDPYPCRDDTYPVPLDGCNYNFITLAVTAAEKAGLPQADIVPVYQAFGGGSSGDDDNGSYILPTASQEQQIMSTWSGLIPARPSTAPIHGACRTVTRPCRTFRRACSRYSQPTTAELTRVSARVTCSFR
jgi:hypothetical protein